MRVYLVIMDETEEAVRALRFASRRATKTGGAVHILALVPRECLYRRWATDHLDAIGRGPLKIDPRVLRISQGGR